MIVTIDGPAGAGKSSMARQVAERLKFQFLDTGAMYRAVTLGAIRQQIDWDDTESLVQYVQQVKIDWKEDKIFLDGQDVTEDIRSPTVTGAIRHMADIPEVRKHLSTQQRRIARGRDIVTEGRDQGSDVFPDADCKIFLTASSRERARRRQQQLAEAGKFLPLDEVLQAQDQRDKEDRGRVVGALRAADDAVIIESDGMNPDDVLDRALEIVHQAMARAKVESSD